MVKIGSEVENEEVELASKAKKSKKTKPAIQTPIQPAEIVQASDQTITKEPSINAEEPADWLAAWDPGSSNPPTDASRTLYAIISGTTSRDNKKILAYLREHFNTPDALIRLREYDYKMAIWASRRSKNKA